MTWRRLGVLAVGAILTSTIIAGCATSAPTQTSMPTATLAATPSGVLYALPVGDTGVACAGVGLEEATLTGDPSDPRVAWLTSPWGRRDVLFPRGFTARFSPRLEVLNTLGDVVAREGTVITGGCVTTGNGGPLLILWP
jgi:hypothetical protein